MKYAVKITLCILVLLSLLSLFGCGDNAEAKSAVIYDIDEEFISFDKKTVDFDGTAKGLVDALISVGSLPETVCVNDFHTVGKVGWIDLNKAYGDSVRSSSFAEWAYIGVVVNSFLETYELEKILITVDGDVLTTGHHGDFDSLLGYKKGL